MNWLAHLHLSLPSSHARVGGLLPDLLARSELEKLPPEFVPPAEEHQSIDAFTDSHPVFARSRSRVSSKLRRFSGVLVDLFYDHHLTINWSRFSPGSVESLIADFYRDIELLAGELPAFACERLTQIRDGGWLSSYGQAAGVQDALTRVGRRLKRPVDLTNAVDEMTANYDALEADFLEFYPQLQEHVSRHRRREGDKSVH